MKKRIVFGGFFILFIITLIYLGNLSAYSTDFTHPHLIRETVKFYSNYLDYSFTDEEINWLIKGNRNEDTPPRYINHFYDPINNQPWLGDNPTALTAKEWANNSKAQSISIRGDQTFDRAIYEYRKGNKKSAFIALGHVLHLIQDVSVPEHTRNDTHIPGFTTESPYEVWAEKYNQTHSDPIAQNLIDKNKVLSFCFSLDNCFDEVAGYSNGYFFSIDSIDDYEKPSIVTTRFEDGVMYGHGKDIDGSEFRLIKFITDGNFSWRNFNEITDYDFDDKILSDYWTRLSAKSVQSGATIIKLFFDEIEFQEQNNIPNKKPLSWWRNLTNQIRTFFGFVPTTIATREFVLAPSDEQLNDLEEQALDGVGAENEGNEPSSASSFVETMDDKKATEGEGDTEGSEGDDNPLNNSPVYFVEGGEILSNPSLPNPLSPPALLAAPPSNSSPSFNTPPDPIATPTEDDEEETEDVEEEIDTRLYISALPLPLDDNYIPPTPNNNEPDGVGGELIDDEIDDGGRTLADMIEKYGHSYGGTWTGSPVPESSEDEEDVEEEDVRTGHRPVLEQEDDESEDVDDEQEDENTENTEDDEGDAEGDDPLDDDPLVNPEEGGDETHSTPRVLISEIKIGGVGTGESKNEFVELYNPGPEIVSLDGWKLRPFTKTGNTKSYLLRPFPENAMIFVNGYYLITHTEGYHATTTPDAIYSTGSSISNDNGLILYNSEDEIMDIVGWGELESSEIYEDQPAPSIPKGYSLERKANMTSTAESMIRCGIDEWQGNGLDTNNNFNDFILRENSDPQNSGSLGEPREVDVSGICIIPDDEEDDGDEDGDDEGDEEDADPLDDPDDDDYDGDDEGDEGDAEGDEEDGDEEDEEDEEDEGDVNDEGDEKDEEGDGDDPDDPEKDPMVVFSGPPVLTGALTNDIMVLVPELSPYIVSGEFFVDENATLIIEPGVVLKFGKEYMATWMKFPTRLRVAGSLYVNGTAENPVIFTSIADDRFGGDTNGDGSTTTPAPFDWSRLLIESGENNQINISHAQFYYAGNDTGSFGNKAALVSRGGVIVNVDHCYFADNPTAVSNFGWKNTESQQINLTNTLIENNSSGVILDVYAPIRIFNTTIRNNTNYGIYLEAYSSNVFYAKYNNIYGNGKYGLWNFYGWNLKSKGWTLAEISAQNNWWGDASGPAPEGAGDKVGDSVDYSNHLTEQGTW